MKINYLTTVKSNKLIDGHLNKKATISEIDELEQRVGKSFPKAYREFLYLCGKGSSMLADLQHEIDVIEEIQEWAQEALEEVDYSISKPFWVIGEFGGAEQFIFFYWSDSSDDPKVYLCDRPYWGRVSMGSDYKPVRKIADKLSDFLTERVDYRKKAKY